MKDCNNCEYFDTCIKDDINTPCYKENDSKQEENKKKCPLLSITNGTAYEDCLKEECEFWCGWTHSCALPAIASMIADLRR